MKLTDFRIDNLLAYEEFLPVLTPFRGGWAAGFSPIAGSVAGLVAKIE